MTSYCSYEDVKALTGTQLPQVDVEAMIRAADRAINIRLGQAALSPDYAADELISAGINYTKALIATRLRMDGTKPNTLTVGPLTMSDNVDSIVNGHLGEAFADIDRYIRRVSGLGTENEGASRCDGDMVELRLDQGCIPKYGED